MTEVKRYEIEVVRRVFDNELGEYFTVGPDKDGLGLIEIADSEDGGRLVVQPAHALVLADAITVAAKEMLQ